MRILVCALIGLIIFVSQPGTVIVVGDFPTREIGGADHATPVCRYSEGAIVLSSNKSFVLRDCPNTSGRPDTTPVQLVGPKRGPVK